MDLVRVGRVVRAVRLKMRWRQLDLSARAGVSSSAVSRVERGRLREVSLETLERITLALDIDLALVPRWRGGDLDRTLNARHAALAERAITWISSLGPWVVRPEVSFSIYGERGIVDILAWWADRRALLLVELKTEIVDVGELLGTFGRKRRLAPQIASQFEWRPDVVGAALLVDEGTTNRRRLANHATTFRAAMPDDGRAFRAWLSDPSRPLAAISFLPDSQRATGRRAPASVRRVRCPRDRRAERRSAAA